MKKVILGAAIIALIVAGALGYIYYYGPANVRLVILDPPPQPYDSSITHIYVTFTKIEVHVANAANESGWHTLANNASIDLMTVLSTSTLVSRTQVPAGHYTELRFFAGEATITIASLNVKYTIPSGEQSGFKVVIQDGFLVSGGQTTNVQLDIAFRNNEILNPSHNLTPVASASVQ